MLGFLFQLFIHVQPPHHEIDRYYLLVFGSGMKRFVKLKGVKVSFSRGSVVTVTKETGLSGTLEILSDWQLIRQIPVPKRWYLSASLLLPFL